MKPWFLCLISAIFTLVAIEGFTTLFFKAKRSASLISQLHHSEVDTQVNQRSAAYKEEDDDKRLKYYFVSVEDLVNSEEVKTALKSLGLTMAEMDFFIDEDSESMEEKDRALVRALAILYAAGYSIENTIQEHTIDEETWR